MNLKPQTYIVLQPHFGHHIRRGLPTMESLGLKAGLGLSLPEAEPSNPISPLVGPGWVGLWRAGYPGLSGFE